MAQDLEYWLALSRTPGLGSRSITRLLEEFGNPRRLFENIHGSAAASRLQPKSLAWLKSPDWSLLEPDLRWLDQPGCDLVTLDDSRYPPLLRQITDPPHSLFVRGDAECLAAPQLAMVGSRSPTPAGLRTARDFARCLAESGMTITSGLALGIDGESHRGALDVGGRTLAVMATGPDRIYPARHRRLAARIAEQGALVTEFPAGTPVRRGHFPRRNRLISGLGAGTLVVEAARLSGSLITARLAAEQGREVFAIPGSIHNPRARGCHALIRDGAKLVETARHVMEELGPLLGHLWTPADGDDQPREADSGTPGERWDGDYRLLLDCLGSEELPADLLIERTGLTADSVSSMLLLLELEGYVSSNAGGRYCRTGKASRILPPTD